MLPLQSKYKVDNKEYNYNASILRIHYKELKDMNDDEFIENIFKALHFACFMSFVKKINHIEILSDHGVIHELVHLGNSSTRDFTDIQEVRNKFNKIFVDIPNSFDINDIYPNHNGQ